MNTLRSWTIRSNINTNVARLWLMFFRKPKSRSHRSIAVAAAWSVLRFVPGVAARANAAHAQPIVAASIQFQ